MDETRHVDVNDSFYPEVLQLLRVNNSCVPVELCVAVADPRFPRGRGNPRGTPCRKSTHF